MSSTPKYEVIILWGGEEVEDFYDYSSWTPEVAKLILNNVAVYDYPTEDEAEAFREGLCAVKSPTARDFTEITRKSYESLQHLANPPKAKKSRRSSRELCNRLQKCSEERLSA